LENQFIEEKKIPNWIRDAMKAANISLIIY